MKKEIPEKLLTTLLTIITLCVFSCSNMINDMRAMSNSKKPVQDPETINEIWIEKINTEDYELTDTAPEEGFYLIEEKSEKDDEGNIYNRTWYKRNRVKIGFDPDGGFWPMKSAEASDEANKSEDIKWDIHKYGEEIRVPAVQRTPTDDDATEWLIFKTGYGFNGWDACTIGENTYEITPMALCPALENGSELVFKAIWTPNKDTRFKVNYWLQEAESDGRVKREPSDIFTGTTGETTQVTAPEIPGFEQTGIIQNEIIKGDGSTEIDITYNRKIITLTFKTGSDKVKWADNTTEDITVSGKYGATVNKESVKELVHEDPNFKFSGWNHEGGVIPDLFPLENKEFTSVWANPYKDYKVFHYFQNTALNGYDLNDALTTTKTGTIGKLTNAIPVEAEGFSVSALKQKTLTDDQESNDIEIYYDRASVKISLNPDSGKWKDATSEIKEVSAVYGVPVSDYPELADREGFKFTGWKNAMGQDASLPSTGPSENLFLTAAWERTIANYTILCWFQKTTLGTDKDTDYEADDSKTVYSSGTIGQNTNVTADTFTGFVTPDTIEVKTITSDNSTVINLYYDRKPVTITLNADGGKWTDDSTQKIIHTHFGVPVTYPSNPAKSDDEKGYSLTGWKVNDTETVLTTLPATAGAEDVTYTALWTVSNATYKVIHCFQNISLDGYDEADSQTETFNGTIDEYTTAAAKTVDGFISKPFSQVKITESGTTVKIYYDRKQVKIIFDAAGGTWTDQTKEPIEINTHFGVPVTYPEKPVLEHFEFNAWDTPSLTSAPLNDIRITALWTQIDASYKVKHLYQNNTLDGYNLDSTETLYGTIGANTNAAAKTPAGFTAEVFENKTIAADNSTVIEIKYNRNSITLTLKANEGKWSDDSTADIIINTRYGVSIPSSAIPENPVREHYSFAGWKFTVNGDDRLVQELPLTGPQTDRVYTARWTQTEAVYKVKYLFEKTDGSGYEENSSYTEAEFYGTLNSMTNASAPDITGFDVYSIENKEITVEPAVVEIKYIRKEYTVSFDPYGGYWKENNQITSVSMKQKYGSSYSVPAAASVERLDFTFNGWKTDSGDSPDGIIPAENIVYKAQWTYGGSIYYVVHKFQSLTNPEVYEESPLYAAEEKAGVLMETTAAEAKNVPGFTAQPISQMTISAGGLTRVSVLYDRKDITLTFKANGGKFSDGTLVFSKTGKYGAATAGLLPADPSIEDPLKTFDGWTDTSGNKVDQLPETFPSEGTTFEASWKDIPASTIHGTGTYTNKDLTVTYLFSSDTLSFTVTHELSDLELTYLEIGGESVSVSGITVTKTSIPGKTQYDFSVPFTKGAGNYGLTLEMANDKLTYTLPNKVMTKN